MCIISFGPIETKSNGYFVRVWNIVKEISKFKEVIILEFPEVRMRRIKKTRYATFLRLRGNEKLPKNSLNFWEKFLTFNPAHSIKFQLLSFVEIWKCRRYLSLVDVVFVEGCLLIAGVIIAKLLRKKLILDTHCVNTLLAKDYEKKNLVVYFLRTFFWAFFEWLAFKLSDMVVVVCEEEKKFIIKKYKIDTSKVFVLPNTIESPKKISKKLVRNLRKKLGLNDKIIVTFVGNLESVQNADAVEYIIEKLAPTFLEKRKKVVFLLVGKGKEKFRSNLPNLKFVGFVKNLAPYLLMSDVCIAPLRVGAGVKTKILEYLAYGKPIVTTKEGIKGVEEIVNSNLLNVSSLQTFPKVLDRVISTRNNFTSSKEFYKVLQKTFRDKLKELLSQI